MASAVGTRGSRGGRGAFIAVLLGSSMVGAGLHAEETAQVAVASGAPGVVLRASNGTSQRLPVVSERVKIDIDRQYATIVIEQAIKNPVPMRIEGWFSMRAMSGANVDGFSYWNGEQKIVGEMFERDAARRIYESTVARQRDPGLLEASGDGSFGFRIFPIESHETKRYEVKLSSYLTRKDRMVELVLPLSGANGQGAGGALHTTEVDVKLHDERGIGRVASPTHKVHSEGAGERVRVRVGTPNEPQPSSFVLRYEVKDAAYALSAVVHEDAGQSPYVLTTLSAPKVDEKLSQDVTIVIDATQDMDREAITLARMAATRLISAMNGSDRLNLVLLKGEGMRTLGRTPLWLTDQVRNDASALIAEAEPEGIRSVLEPLAAVERAASKERTSTVVFISNGAKTAAALQEIGAPKPGSSRIYTIGVGPNVNRAAMSRLSSQTGGRFEFLATKEMVGPGMQRLEASMAAPILRKLSLAAEGAELVSIYPRTLPDLFPGQELVIKARVKGSVKDLKLTLTGRTNERALSFRTRARRIENVRRPFIGKLWGRARIDDLLEEIALGGSTAERTQETIELALAYDVMTPYTAFLAIPESEITWERRAMMNEAREQKRQARARFEDASALQTSDGYLGVAKAPASSPPEPMNEPTAARELPTGGDVDDARVRGGGCAGCRVSSSDERYPLLSLVALALGALWRRSSRARRSAR